MLLAVLLVCVALFVVLPLVGAAVNVLWALLLGLLLGLVARAIAPGRGRLGTLTTALVGVAGGLLGGAAARALELGDLGRITLQVLAAVGLVTVLRNQRALR